MITDAITIVKYALDIIKIPPERIIIMGQSLGTAVSVAVAEHFVTKHKIEFKGIVLVAPFTDLPTLILDYAIGGVFPILSPLKAYPRLQQYFASFIQDDWRSLDRVKSLVKSSDRLNLQLIHALDDFEIPYRHSEMLFEAASTYPYISDCATPGYFQHNDVGYTGPPHETCRNDDRTVIHRTMTPYGGRN